MSKPSSQQELPEDRGTGVPPVRGINQFTSTERNLPHWQEPGSVYFVTWRTARSIELNTNDRTVTLDALLHWNEKRWIVFAAVVMPDHVHVLAKPLPLVSGAVLSELTHFHPLGEILHSVKSFSAHQINRCHGRVGRVWQDERYDRIVRDDCEFEETWRYIACNAVEAGFSTTIEGYRWYYRCP